MVLKKGEKIKRWQPINCTLGLTFTEIYERIISAIENCSDLIWLASKGAGGGNVVALDVDSPAIGVTLNVGSSFKVEDEELLVRLACHVEHTIADVYSFALLEVLGGVGRSDRVVEGPIEDTVMR